MLDLANVQAPIEKAHRLRNTHYIDLAMYQNEQNTFLRDSWVAVGFGKDIPQPGRLKPVSFAGFPILLVRIWDGNVNVFQNFCPHRGMILIDEAKRCAVRSPNPIIIGPLILTAPRARPLNWASTICTRMTRSNFVTSR